MLAGIRNSAVTNSVRVPRVSSQHPRAVKAIRFPRVIDSAGLLPAGEAVRFEDYLRRVREESGVDVRLLFLAHRAGIPLSEYDSER
jgi:hypothetical protein